MASCLGTWPREPNWLGRWGQNGCGGGGGEVAEEEDGGRMAGGEEEVEK